MFAVKGIYKDGKIELVEFLPSEIKEAEVYIVIVPKPKKESDEDFFNYISEWKNPEEEEVWK